MKIKLNNNSIVFATINHENWETTQIQLTNKEKCQACGEYTLHHLTIRVSKGSYCFFYEIIEELVLRDHKIECKNPRNPLYELRENAGELLGKLLLIKDESIWFEPIEFSLVA